MLEKFCSVTPRLNYLPNFDPKEATPWYGIRALWYEGASYDGKKTKVFAHIGYPKDSENKKHPAVVLIHGGGGHAFPEWVRLWNEKGFVAIAMDTTGYFPREDKRGELGTENHTMKQDYVHELYGELCEDGFTVGPDNTSMQDYENKRENQWMYHAVAASILAHNILLSDERVDTDKIGIVGISWGSVVTSIALGYDTRYAFAIPIYGGAYLDYKVSPKLPRIFRNPTVKEMWSAADRLSRVTCPVLWKSFLYDHAFSMASNNLSYIDTRKSGSFLSMSRKMGHSHIEAWSPLDSYRFARRIADDKLPLIRPLNAPQGFGEIKFTVEIPDDFDSALARIVYSTIPMEYTEDGCPKADWKVTTIDLSGNTVSGIVPENTVCYFVELVGVKDGVEFVSDTEITYDGEKGLLGS